MQIHPAQAIQMYAYRAVASSNQDFIRELKGYGVLKSPRVEQALVEVDRADFISDTSMRPYVDAPQSIGYGQTISAPHMHITAVEAVQDLLQPGAKVLDVGSGSGFLTALFSKMMSDQGTVVGIDFVDALVDKSIGNMAKHHQALLECGAVILKQGDGWVGDPEHSPFDVIHVGAAADRVPSALLAQLKKGGRMVIPVGSQSSHQDFLILDKDLKGTVTKRKLMSVRYVPLVHPH